MSKESDSRHRVVLVASPGVPLFELSIPAEVFGIDRRELTPQWYDFALVSTDEPGTAVAHGLVVPAGAGLAALEQADTVVVPACADVQGAPPPALVEALRAAHARGTRIAATCTGSFVLAEAGLLDGRRAATHWMHADALRRRYPSVRVDEQVLYVHDDVWTSAGSAAGLDMCLELVRRDLGSAVANELARRIVVPPHRGGGQAQFIRPSTRTAGPRRDVQEWARAHLADATVVAMAEHAGVSTRTLHRQFLGRTGQSPQAWLQGLRLDTAAELLESTDLGIGAVAHRVGLGTATNLRAQFAAAYGVPPSDYRATFRGRDAS
ncbi:GlxA family transcriptional regulator [Nocardioides anomalus]|uniref:GlxA family transcriptional regulator n=1 Tax=Nocardioides anomalus TaxID=2712223 RepID=UPI001E4F9117|nr:helix-turn-helix domain-containing protein [Nocardioides anomalus]